MAGISGSHALANPSTVVISPQYCVDHPVDLTITRKMMTMSEGNFTVTDASGDVVFTVTSTIFTLHDQRVLHDAAGKRLVTYRQKHMSARRRWVAFRGESKDDKDLIFSIRKSSLLQTKTKLDVFLATNTSNDEICDFRIEGSWFERSCVIYAGNSDTIIAQMHKKFTGTTNLLIGKDTFGVTVYPNVDYAFVTSLVLLLDEISEERANA